MVIGSKVLSGETSGARTIESKKILLDTLTSGAINGNTISPNNITGDIVEPKVLNGKVIGEKTNLENLLSSNSPATDLENLVSEGAKSLTIDEVPGEIRGLWQGKVNPKGSWQGGINPNLGLLLGVAAPGLGALAAYGIIKGIKKKGIKSELS